MKIKMLRTLMVDGKIAMSGTEVETNDRDGHALIRRGAAEPIGEVAPKSVKDDGFLDETETPAQEPAPVAPAAPEPKSKRK
jgi:hypothetical protein